jgi:dihydropteroate synthase
VEPQNIIVDPGIGFGKTLEHNLELLRNLDAIAGLGLPVLVGASRKKFIGTITGVEQARDRVSGTLAANVLAYERGASLFRVHDVRANREALAVARAIRFGAR